MAKIETLYREISSILSAVGHAPPECAECVAYHQEGHISVPCSGDFDCEWRREQRGGGEDA